MKTRIHIISASFNAGNCIGKLIQSLESQTDKDFVWILVDGGSNDDTLGKAEKIQGIAKRLILNKNDFGIYHAINTGLELCNEGYYVVAGCDDVFYADAVANFKKAILDDNADIIAANVNFLQRLNKPKGSHFVWLYGGSGLIAAHSVGTAIRCSLHKKLGNYSNMYPVYADGEFIIRALVSGAKFLYPDFVAGEFSKVSRCEGGDCGWYGASSPASSKPRTPKRVLLWQEKAAYMQADYSQHKGETSDYSDENQSR